MSTYLITGGAGFVGTNLCLFLLEQNLEGTCVISVDKLVHGQVQSQIIDKRYTFIQADVKDAAAIARILRTRQVDIVIHLAAHVSVDVSFTNGLQYTKDNVVGTHVLLECCRLYGKIKRFLYFSTDEVYGEVSEYETSGYLEDATLNPMNPYAASKLGAECLVTAYGHSFGFPCLITRANNIYGPHQYPVALIPRFIRQLTKGEKCCIHGDGTAKRCFIHVYDICRAVATILEKGAVGEIYNIASTDEYSVCQIHNELVNIIRRGDSPESFRKHVDDRPHNDSRYMIDASKLLGLGWTQTIPFKDGIRSTVDWYKNKQVMRNIDS